MTTEKTEREIKTWILVRYDGSPDQELDSQIEGLFAAIGYELRALTFCDGIRHLNLYPREIQAKPRREREPCDEDAEYARDLALYAYVRRTIMLPFCRERARACADLAQSSPNPDYWLAKARQFEQWAAEHEAAAGSATIADKEVTGDEH